MSLMTLQSVPGLVRYRTLNIDMSPPSSVKSDNHRMPLLSMEPSMEDAIQSARYATSSSQDSSEESKNRGGYTFALSLSTPSPPTISSAQSYSAVYQSQNGRLHLLNNSCLNYAFGLIQHFRQ
eukprot:2791342-Ditylum_brightwellii.AAC.1